MKWKALPDLTPMYLRTSIQQMMALKIQMKKVQFMKINAQLTTCLQMIFNKQILFMKQSILTYFKSIDFILIMNSTQLIRSGINIFLAIAVVVSIIQEIDFSSSKPVTQQQAPVPQIPVNGTKVEGLVILSTDGFRKQFKDLLVQKEYNIDIKDYPFENEEYWINLFLTHGHMIVVFFLVSRYQGEQDQGKKTKLMIIGMGLVFVWMMATPHFRTQRLGLQYKGQKIYQKDIFDEAEIFKNIQEYDDLSTFGLDPTPAASSQKDVKFSTESEVEEEVVVVHEDF